MRAWVIGAAVMLAGCIDSQLTLCGDGTACPASLVCDQAHHSCVAPDQLAACAGISDGGACHTSEVEGACFDGVCLLPGCGNRVVEPGEECDDGNHVGGDGCSADCRSDERCGNGVADVTLGEQCDDGNLASHDGCDSRCQAEAAVWRFYPALLDRISNAAAFDVAHERLVMAMHRTAWQWDGMAWSVMPALLPEVDAWQAAVYDSDRGHVVLIGARASMLVVVDGDGTRWTELSAGAAPDPGVVAAAVYDPAEQAIVWLSSSQYGELTIRGGVADWSGGSLLPFSATSTPHAAFDAARGAVVVVDADASSTWEWAAASGWTRSAATPDGQGGHALVYDPDRGHVLALGGGPSSGTGSASANVLAWSGSAWDDTGARITPRENAVAWHDPGRHSVGIAGGSVPKGTIDQPLVDVIELANTTLTPHPVVAPTGANTIAVDTARDQIVLVNPPQGTLAWNDGWDLVSTSTVSKQSTLVYDPVRGAMLAYDFTTGALYLLSSDWQQISTPSLATSAITYDFERRAIAAVNSAATIEMPSASTSFQPVAPGFNGSIQAGYDLSVHAVSTLGSSGLADLVGTQWQRSLAPSGSYLLVTALQTASLVLVPQSPGLGDTQIWERHAGTFRALDALPFAGQVTGAVERSRGRLVLEMFDGPGVVFAERQLVSGLADETCTPSDDADGDGLSGCDDPDCWATCWPACPLATSCP